MKSIKRVTAKRVIVGGIALLALGRFVGVDAHVGNKKSVSGVIGAGASALVGDMFGAGDQDSNFGDPAREFHMQQDPDISGSIARSLNSGATHLVNNGVNSRVCTDQDHVNIFISVPIAGNKTQNNKKKKKQDSQDQDTSDGSDDAPDGPGQDGGPGTHENSALFEGLGASSGLDTCEKLEQALTGESSTQAFWKSIVKGNREYKKAAQKAGALLYRASQVGGAFILMGNMVLAHQNSKNWQSQRDMKTPGAPSASQFDTMILLMNVVQAAALPSAIALLNSAFQGCK